MSRQFTGRSLCNQLVVPEKKEHERALELKRRERITLLLFTVIFSISLSKWPVSDSMKWSIWKQNPQKSEQIIINVDGRHRLFSEFDRFLWLLSIVFTENREPNENIYKKEKKYYMMMLSEKGAKKWWISQQVCMNDTSSWPDMCTYQGEKECGKGEWSDSFWQYVGGIPKKRLGRYFREMSKF